MISPSEMSFYTFWSFRYEFILVQMHQILAFHIKKYWFMKLLKVLTKYFFYLIYENKRKVGAMCNTFEEIVVVYSWIKFIQGYSTYFILSYELIYLNFPTLEFRVWFVNAKHIFEIRKNITKTDINRLYYTDIT